MLATLLLAAEKSNSQKIPFFIFAALLVSFALSLSFVGTRRHGTFPPSQRAANAIIAVCVVLVAGTMVTAVITA